MKKERIKNDRSFFRIALRDIVRNDFTGKKKI